MDELTAVSRENLGVEHPDRYRPMKGLGRLGNVLDRIFMAAGYLSGLLFLLLAFSWFEIVLGVWSLVLACNAIAEVQSYRSAWRGFGNICDCLDLVDRDATVT